LILPRHIILAAVLCLIPCVVLAWSATGNLVIAVPAFDLATLEVCMPQKCFLTVTVAETPLRSVRAAIRIQHEMAC